MTDFFDAYLIGWTLTPDGEPIQTHSSRLLPVRCVDGAPAMLKIAHEDEERSGGLLLEWWDGQGAAHVLDREGDALLMERALGTHSLIGMVHHGDDDEATRIICRAAAQLHAPRNEPLPELVSLTRWFQELVPAAAKFGGVLTRSALIAQELLADPQEVVVLHGDMHHGNVLDFGRRGWLVIDPKGLSGERGFDYANLFCNPDSETAIAPGRLARQVAVVCEEAGMDRERLLRWIVAWAGLSAAWMLGDGMEADHTLQVAEIAAAELDR